MARSYDPAKMQFWQQVLARRQASGLTVRAYCEVHGLAEQNFYRWQRVLAERRHSASRQRRGPRARPTPAAQVKAEPLFVPIDVDASGTRTALEVVLAHGRSIRVRPGFDAATLGQLVACLEGARC